MSLIKGVLNFTLVIYQAGLILLWLLQRWIGEEVIGMGIVKTLLHLLLAPSLLLLPICLLLRRWWAALAAAAAVVAFMTSYGPLFVPRAKNAATTSPSFSLLSFNLQSPDEQETAALVRILDTAAADVVALQELSPAAAAALEAQLGRDYPYRAFHSEPGFAGQGVLSRYPITADDYWRYEDLPGALGHQRVGLRIAGHPVVLYNVHPVPSLTFRQGLNAAPHRAAITELLAKVEGEVDPVLLAGDFNMTDQFHGYRRLVEHYTDAFRAVGEVGFGFTFPNKESVPLPAFLRLDYIFYDATFRGTSAQVWPSSGSSDHAPVLAHLALRANTDTGNQ